MASEVWIKEHDPEFVHVYRAHRHWKRNEPYGEPFADWMERNYRCYVIVPDDYLHIGIPNICFLSPADKTFFLLKWS